MLRVPSDREIRALHEKHAASAADFEVVWTHCEIVCGIAEQVAGRVAGVDLDLVRAGCLVHDIGVYRLRGEPYIRHGVIGHRMLAEEGYPEAICRFCSCHTGVGVTRRDIEEQGLALPVGDYVAGSPEERLVMYADKFHTKTDPPAFLTADEYAESLARFGADKVAAFRRMVEQYGEPDLGAFVGRYGHRAAG